MLIILENLILKKINKFKIFEKRKKNIIYIIKMIPDIFNIKCIVVKRLTDFYAEEKAAAIRAITKYLGCDIAKRTAFARYDIQSALNLAITEAKAEGFLPILMILGGTDDTLKCLQVTVEVVFATYGTSNFLLDFPNCRLGVLPTNLNTMPEPEYIIRNSLSNSNINIACKQLAIKLGLNLSSTINYSANANSTVKYNIDYLTEYKKVLVDPTVSVQVSPEFLIMQAKEKPTDFFTINYLSDDLMDKIKDQNITNLYYADSGLAVFFRLSKQTDVLKFEVFEDDKALWKVIYKNQLVGYTSYYALVSGGVNPNNPTTNYYERILQYMENAANAIFIQFGKQGESGCFEDFFRNFEFTVI